MNAPRNNAAIMADVMGRALRDLETPQPIGDEAFFVGAIVEGQTVEPMEGEPGIDGLKNAAIGLLAGYWGNPSQVSCTSIQHMTMGPPRITDAMDKLAEVARDYCYGAELPFPSWADPDGRHAYEREQERGYEAQVRSDYRAGVER